MLGPVDDRGFVGAAGAKQGKIGEVSDFAFDGGEFKRESESGSKFGEAVTGGLEQVKGGPEAGDADGKDWAGAGGEYVEEAWPLEALHDVEAGDADGKDWAGAGGEYVEEAWPLEALHDVEVDDVSAVVGGKSLENGLIGCEMRELKEWRKGIEEIEGARDPR
ncbi:hypothetical protein HPP92_018446 [Vanilla planifolia]|uniref:Uncharacterized protein n=1 Tax=Vanilla planifolia TaxID=51239 RepID=A0A835Q5R0_VANPL|nr:hypothetical protein HPP92_018446 [Vanilla planifolia]